MEERLLRLLDGCLKNDRISQKLLYQEFYNFAMNICLRYTSNRYEASEVLNDGFFKAFLNLAKFDRARPFKAWLGRIMHNTSIDYYRTNLKVAFMEDLDHADAMESDISVEHHLDYEDLLAVIRRLPNAYRMVFNLYEIDGYSHEEIAGMLKISAGTSRSNLFKAKKKLQELVSLHASAKLKDQHTEAKVVALRQPDKNVIVNKNRAQDE